MKTDKNKPNLLYTRLGERITGPPTRTHSSCTKRGLCSITVYLMTSDISSHSPARFFDFQKPKNYVNYDKNFNDFYAKISTHCPFLNFSHINKEGNDHFYMLLLIERTTLSILCLSYAQN